MPLRAELIKIHIYNKSGDCFVAKNAPRNDRLRSLFNL